MKNRDRGAIPVVKWITNRSFGVPIVPVVPALRLVPKKAQEAGLSSEHKNAVIYENIQIEVNPLLYSQIGETALVVCR